MPVAVRPATPADIAALRRMKRELLAFENSLHVDTASDDDWRRDGFGPHAQFHAFVAEVDRQIVGMVTYSKRGFPGWRGRAFFVHDLYVDAAHRRRGCARALMAALAAKAQAQNAAFVELTVHANNDARNFYSRLGFAHVSHCMSYAAAQPALHALAGTSARLLSFPPQERARAQNKAG